MTVHPVGHPLAEIQMVVRRLQISGATLSRIFPLTMPRLGKPRLAPLHQPHLMIGILRTVLDPAPEKNNPVGHEIRAVLVLRDHLFTFESQGLVEPLVGIEMEDPRMLELDMIQRVIALRPEVIERPLEDARPASRGDFARPVGAVRIQHNHVIAPRHRIETGRNIGLLVFGEDQDGKH